MREMKDSGISWIGKIPKNWNLQKIKELFYITGGCGFKEIFQGKDFGDYPFMKASDISGHEKFISSASNYVSESLVKQERYNVIPQYSILMAKIGEALKKNHRRINTVKCIVDNNCQAISLIDNLSNINFYYYFMLCIDMIWFDNGGTIPCVNNQAFLNSFVLVPSLAEQKAIANYLDLKCNKIDTLTADIESQIETLEQYKRSVITEAITKGLNPNIEMKDSGVEFIGNIPKHWGIRKIKTLGSSRNGLTYSPIDLCDKECGILVLRSSNVQNGKINLKDNVHVKCPIPEELMVRENDILICSRNGSRELIGKNALIPRDITATFGAFMMIYRTKEPIYMYYILNSAIFTYYLGSFSTSTINQLTRFNFENMKVPYCNDVNERNCIVEYLDYKCKEIDSIIADKQTQLETLTEYKKSLIYEYVTGKKEVPTA